MKSEIENVDTLILKITDVRKRILDKRTEFLKKHMVEPAGIVIGANEFVELQAVATPYEYYNGDIMNFMGMRITIIACPSALYMEIQPRDVHAFVVGRIK